MKRGSSWLGAASGLLLAGCATAPLGPLTVRALPPQGKLFGVFEQENAACKAYARNDVQGMTDQANQRAALTALAGAALGAGLGGAANGGAGAAAGAAFGGTAGAMMGAGGSQRQGDRIQILYDNAYAQCMVAHGNVLQSVGYGYPVVVTMPQP